MKDVNFSYVEGTRVITDSYFKACPGEIVALVAGSCRDRKRNFKTCRKKFTQNREIN